MKTVALPRNTPCLSMFNLNFLSFLCKPKVMLMLFLLDLSGVFQFINKYVFSDLNFLKFLAVALTVDLITGICKVAATKGIKAITSKSMRVGTITKVVSYSSFLILIHVVTHLEVNGKVTMGLEWINKIALEFVIIVEARSIYENLIAINPKLDFIDTVLQNILNKFKTKPNDTN